MEYIDHYPGFQIAISHMSDGDFRDARVHPEYIRAYRQAHGKDIYTLTEANKGTPFTLYDGIYTRLRGVSVGCLSADCPIIIVMGDGEAMALHSGWRGTRLSIVDEIPNYLSTPPENLRIYIGPHIQRYEVGSEFSRYFDEKYLTPHGEKYLLDLVGKITDDIVSLGIPEGNIEMHGEDTFESQLYQSYRRDPSLGIGYIGVKMC